MVAGLVVMAAAGSTPVGAQPVLPRPISGTCNTAFGGYVNLTYGNDGSAALEASFNCTSSNGVITMGLSLSTTPLQLCGAGVAVAGGTVSWSEGTLGVVGELTVAGAAVTVDLGSLGTPFVAHGTFVMKALDTSGLCSAGSVAGGIGNVTLDGELVYQYVHP
ncbi:MAG TPA: hypothetical protein VG245_08525 [Candidatus Dormibacteraeota bacterium]|nr:hypothetical protein [Candidatus Dormibacteraeota bacterium]